VARAQKKEEIAPGTILGEKYRVEGMIGQGGMAIVVMARHIELGQHVAIKLLPAAYHKDSELVARFMREAQAAVRLRSEHVVKVSDVGRQQNGGPYMVMELLSGEDLARVISRGPLAIEFAIECILQVCEAVAEAHSMGIVHRDLKPKNLFLLPGHGERPFVKVLDFGLAKHVSLMNDTAALTATTAVLGSPHYMSPEQMRASKNVDTRTDIWALGVCLFELLTGEPPFPGETVAVVCAQVLKQPPVPLTRFLPNAPPGLAQAIDRCLQKDPAERFLSVVELARALDPFAPPRAKGAADRIAKVLRAAPTVQLSTVTPYGQQPHHPQVAVGRDTVTGATLDSDPRVRTARLLIPIIVVGSTLLVAAAAILLAIFLRRPRAEIVWPATSPLPSASPSSSSSFDDPNAAMDETDADANKPLPSSSTDEDGAGQSKQRVHSPRNVPRRERTSPQRGGVEGAEGQGGQGGSVKDPLKDEAAKHM
jgi:tRNA A-37 threonylcarbamoyl transferase component Bud32